MMAGTKGKVCVTGSAGFLGSWLVKRLLESGYHVEGTVRDPGDYRKIGHLWELDGAKERLHLTRAELLEEGSFDEAIVGCEGVFHAAFPVIHPKNDPKTEVLDPAIKGTLNVLKSCKKNPMLKKVVLTSSVSAVARPVITPEGPYDENTWTCPELCEKLKLWYPMAKALAEKAAWDFAKENNINLVTVVPSFIIGPSLPHNLHTTSLDFLSLLKGDEGQQYSRRGRMGYVHINDAAECHIKVYEDDNAEGRYICTSSVLEVPQLSALLAKHYPWLKNMPLRFDNYVQRPQFEYDTSKVKKLGIKFREMEEIFDDCIQSLKEQGYLP